MEGLFGLLGGITLVHLLALILVDNYFHFILPLVHLLVQNRRNI